MQTKFTEKQLEDKDVAESERILRKCVHCGFCTATCPTYVLLGDELDSPRGRIYLIKDMLENERPATAEVVQHIDRCLSCLACMTTCPSGVHYQHLIDHARVHVERTYRRPWDERAVRALLAAVLPYPARFRLALGLAGVVRPAARLLPQRLGRMLAFVPTRESKKGVRALFRRHISDERERQRKRALTPSLPAERRRTLSPSPKRRRVTSSSSRPRVAVLAGCVESVLAPQVHAAAVRLLSLAGAEVVSVPGCCGAIVHHLGREDANRRISKALMGRLQTEADEAGLDAIAVTASGCGTHAKDYGYLFRSDLKLAVPAAAIAAKVCDITEILDRLGLPEPAARSGLRVAYHSACSMQHGQKVERQPRELLTRAGFDVKEITEGHLCCGSAGTYNLLQPGLAERLRERKLGHIEQVGADVVATGNIGCITQLATGTALPIVHTVELLDWALGGRRPSALDARAES